jgi:UDP-glucose 4-epimerase
VSRIVVTGGAGFIGSHLADGLLARGDDVVVLDDLSTGNLANVPEGAEFVETDVRNVGSVAAGIAGADAVCHIAGQASIFRSFETPESDLAVNVSGTLAVIEACIRERVPRLVYASSMTAYGEPQQVPTPEDHSCVPVSYYGVTKYAAERYVQIAGARDDVDLSTTALRMFNVYGERQSLTNPYQGVLAIFAGNVLRGEPITIHSDGLQTRDFVYVEDVVDAWLRVLDSPATVGKVFNVGSGGETTVSQLATQVIAACGESPEAWPIRTQAAQEGDQRRSAANIDALTAATDWRPTTPFETGMERTIAWARANDAARTDG